MVLDPERIVFEGAVDVEIVVVVIGLAVVHVVKIGAEGVVGQAVSARLLRVFGEGDIGRSCAVSRWARMCISSPF